QARLPLAIPLPDWEASMNLPRAWYLTAGLLLALFGCKSQQMCDRSGSVATQQRVESPWRSEATPQVRSTVAKDSRLLPGGESLGAAVVTYQEPLPRPAFDQAGAATQEVMDSVLSRQWLQAEIEARNPT